MKKLLACLVVCVLLAGCVVMYEPTEISPEVRNNPFFPAGTLVINTAETYLYPTVPLQNGERMYDKGITLPKEVSFGLLFKVTEVRILDSGGVVTARSSFEDRYMFVVPVKYRGGNYVESGKGGWIDASLVQIEEP